MGKEEGINCNTNCLKYKEVLWVNIRMGMI